MAGRKVEDILRERDRYEAEMSGKTWRCDGCGHYYFYSTTHCPYCAEPPKPGGMGLYVALTWLCLVFLAGVFVGAKVTLGWMAGR